MDKIQTIAMYLPQFHRTPENDQWWGQGFTEWTAVKQAQPLFSGHKQPKEPKDGDYYNLLEKKTMLKQAEWMKEYGIDGLCFYHYYFKDGKKLLEKPAENLLRWRDVNMPFCFCWANEGWARTWSNINIKNSWADKYERIDEKNNTGILIEQKYGREENWKEHFEYLLPFFRDERYIKRGKEPIFLIYKPDNISSLYQMTEYWRELAREWGIPNIYFIGLNIRQKKKGLDAVLLNAPNTFLDSNATYEKEKRVKTCLYENVWKSIIAAENISGCKTYFGGFVNYDDTPRHGYNGRVVTGFSVDSFSTYLCQLYQKNLAMGNEYLFLNAWNEWGEGMYLEPDEEYGFQYLETVQKAKHKAILEKFDPNLTNQWSSTMMSGQESYLMKMLNKQRLITNCFDSWMSLREKGLNVADYLKRHHYYTVAMYGMGILGRHLLYDIEHSDVDVAYIIDRRSELKHPELKIVSVEDDFDPVDAIVVTAVADFDEIYEVLKSKINCPVLSLCELISEIE